MNKVKLAIASSLLVIAGYFVGAAGFVSNLGAISGQDGYMFKAVSSANASATVPVKVRGGSGVLGSVIVGTTHATAISIYDGTATSTGTLIASFPASAVVGTYTFDAVVTTGIVLDVPAGYAGVMTVTYK